MTKTDLYEQVTNTIVAELEAGTLPWLKPWDGTGCADGLMPYNAASRRAYTGVNVLTLWCAERFPTNGWLTYRQAQEHGGQVRKGEKGSMIIYIGQSTKEEEDGNGDTRKRSFRFLKRSTVFNVAQCDGLPERMTKLPDPLPEPVRIANAEALIEAAGAALSHGGQRAFYSPSEDRIQLPVPQSFRSPEHYYAVAFHEHGHWTGHKARCARDLSGRFGDRAYAAEELIAELTAAFLCAELGIEGDIRHASYIESWISLLKNDSRAIFTAASAASKAARFLTAYTEAASQAA
ncbi:MAG: zincin-like metallopeptidase domain-containing protein [Planctomycetota bacterium]